MPALPKLAQPPEKYAHLTGDALYRALISDPEPWDTARFAQECQRSIGRVRVWVSKRNAVDQGRRAADDRTPPAPDMFSGRSPLWRAGTLRKWMIKVGLMRRDGVYIAHKPAGRARGATDVIPRQRRDAPMKTAAPTLLEEYKALTDTAGPGRARYSSEAHESLAARHGLTVRQVERRLHAARLIAAAPADNADARTAAAREITTSVREMLAELTDTGMPVAQARVEVARQLGLSVTSVQRIAARVTA